MTVFDRTAHVCMQLLDRNSTMQVAVPPPKYRAMSRSLTCMSSVLVILMIIMSWRLLCPQITFANIPEKLENRNYRP